MPWHQITEKNIQAAIAESKQINNMDVFRELHGDFYPAHGVYMHRGSDGPFEARPLIAAACANLYPGKRLFPHDFRGLNGHEFLEKHFGFERRTINR